MKHGKETEGENQVVRVGGFHGRGAHSKDFDEELGSEGPAEFYGDEVGLGDDADVGVGEDALPAAIPDEEEIVAGFDGPAEAGVGADVLGFGVVLDEAGEDEIGIPSVS